VTTENTDDRAEWLQGSSVQCAMVPGSAQTPWRLVLLGAPGVGKGTQADLLHQRLGACHLSTGDVFRAAASRRECELSPAMRTATEYMRRGALVPDSTVWHIVRVAEWLPTLRQGLYSRRISAHASAGRVIERVGGERGTIAHCGRELRPACE
jgi:hypothetical protein